MSSTPTAADERLRVALAHLRSLGSVERGVLDVTACGTRAIPALREILFAREPSGLYQPRRGAVEALAALGAKDTLISFLSEPRVILDPVERAGEEAVRNAAARALRDCDDPRVPALLLGLARTQLLPGAIEVLGARGRSEALPVLVAALADDIARPSAEAALHQLGEAAVPMLWCAAHSAQPGAEDETESIRRCRRAAVGVLLDLGGAGNEAGREEAEALMHDHDPEIAALACRFLLAFGSAAQPCAAANRLLDLLDRVPAPARVAIEDELVEHADLIRDTEAMRTSSQPLPPEHLLAPRERALRRIATRIGDVA